MHAIYTQKILFNAMLFLILPFQWLSQFLLQANNCLTLVLLGERFVAINGIPISDPQGPQSCVSLCLDMAQAVQ